MQKAQLDGQDQRQNWATVGVVGVTTVLAAWSSISPQTHEVKVSWGEGGTVAIT